MTETSSEDKEKHIETFQNNNILKYTNKIIPSEMDPPLLTKNSSL